MRFRSMVGLASASVGANLVNGFSSSILPLLLDAYGLPHAVVGLIAQERSIAGVVVQPVVGVISDRIETRLGRRRPFFLAGVPLCALVLAVIAASPPMPVLIAVIPLLGLSLAVALDPYNALLVDVVKPDDRGPLGGVMAAGTMAGQVVLLLAAFRLYENHRPWLIGIIIAGLVAGFAITFVSVREPSRQERTSSPFRWQPGAYVRGVLAEREVTKYVGAMFFYFLGYGAASPFITQFAVHVLQVTSGVSFLLVFSAVVATGIAAAPAGLLGRRYGKRRVLAFGVFAYATAALIGSQTQNAVQGFAAMIGLGICGAFPAALISPLLADLIPPKRAGEFIGLVSVVWSLAAPVGAAAAGAFIDVTGTYRAVFVVTAVLYFVSWAFLRTMRTSPASEAEPALEPAAAAG